MKVIALSILVFSLIGCGVKTRGSSQSEVAPGARRISATQAYRLMSEMADFILLDVRSEQEFREQRIEGAILIPAHEIRDRAENLLPDRNQVILLYCRTGRRSAAAASELVRLGYVNVYDFGGIVDWPHGTVRDYN